MLGSLDIDSFRCCETLHLGDLEQVNLLVGRNNAGKTSVLEAMQFLASYGDPYVLWRSMFRRGERHQDEERSRTNYPLFDISHFFFGHQLVEGATFTIGGTEKKSGESRWIRCMLAGADDDLLFEESPGDIENEEMISNSVVLKIDGSDSVMSDEIPVSAHGAVSFDSVRRATKRANLLDKPVEFITTDIASGDSLLRIWRDVVLTDEEELVTDALRLLEPEIERVAIVADDRHSRVSPSRTGVLVKVRGYSKPIPLGSMGEGMWRMLMMSLALIRSAGGVLLVDEIDTGLHHTVMRQLWMLVSETARRLDVQVFATTHSNDCVNALASVLKTGDLRGHAALHRIEKGRANSIRYSENEIVAAAAQGAEVR